MIVFITINDTNELFDRKLIKFCFYFQIIIIRDNKKVGSFPISYDGMSIAVNVGSNNKDVAVGAEDNKIYIYKLVDNNLQEVSITINF